MTRALLALGSNLGDRAEYLAVARRLLGERGARIVRASTVRETEPFGVTDQPAFLNQVLEVDWPDTPRGLLTVAKVIEEAAGRKSTYRWGPREIDIDILTFDGETVDEPGLTIPHPGLRDRPFLRDLLAELELQVPDGS